MSQYIVRIVTPLTIQEYDDAILTDLSKTGDRTDAFLFDFKEKIDGKLRFTGKDKYKEFEDIDKSQLRYVDMYVTIWEKCNDEKVTVLDGKLSFLEAEFDADKCTVSIKVTADNKYLKYDQHKGDTYNLLSEDDFNFSRVTVEHSSLPGTQPIKNGIRLFDALEGLYKKINPLGNLISNFFTNGGYGSTVVGETVLYQKSDVVRRNIATNNATKMEWTLEKLIETTCRQLNLLWRIDDYGNLLIDEIYYYEQGLPIFDLTQLPKFNEIAGLKKWRYQKEKIYKKENYINPSSQNKDFVGKPIIYDNALVNSLDKDAELKITNDFITDVPFLATLDPNDESIDYSGTVLIGYLQVTQGAGTINEIISTGFTLLDPVIKPNNNLSWAYLHLNRFVNYGRFFSKGELNGIQTNFFNIQKNKVLDGLTFKLCCGDEFNPNAYVKTQLGIGKVDRYKYNFGKKTMELDVVFEVVDNINYTLPTIYNDKYCMGANSTFNTSVLGQSSLIQNDTGVGLLVVLAEIKTTTFGGIVEIFTDGHFIYTPPNNFIGQDFFDYIVTDQATNYNGVGHATITVQYPDVYVHQVIDLNAPQGNPLVCDVRVKLFWYKDNAMTQPLDVTGYCFDVNLEDINATPSGTIPPNGVTQTIYDYYCNSGEVYVSPNPGVYTII